MWPKGMGDCWNGRVVKLIPTGPHKWLKGMRDCWDGRRPDLISISLQALAQLPTPTSQETAQIKGPCPIRKSHPNQGFTPNQKKLPKLGNHA